MQSAHWDSLMDLVKPCETIKSNRGAPSLGEADLMALGGCRLTGKPQDSEPGFLI